MTYSVPITPVPISTLFVDIGGVLLTDGWSYEFRQLAVKKFNLNSEEMETLHTHAFETLELGKITMREYLKLVVFYEERDFTSERFLEFILARSEPNPNMIELIRQLKEKYRLKVVAVSNEARKLNAYRIQKFMLNEFIDAFVSSCYVGLRKPDPDIYRMALNIAQVPLEQIVYIENTPMFVRVAEDLGIRSICHTDYNSTREQLASYGLEVVS